MNQAALHPPLTDAERALAVRLRRHVEMLADVIGPRHLGRPSTLEAAEAYVRRELESAGGQSGGEGEGEEVERQTYTIGGQEVANLVVERHGLKHPEQIVIVGAHYDSTPTTPGADDNASAVAALIEIARLLRGRATRRTLRFVAFPNEELPYFDTGEMGSQFHARQCRQRGEKIAGMICLEMLGYYDPRKGSQTYPFPLNRCRWLLPRSASFLAMVGNLRSLRLLWKAQWGFRRTVRFPLWSLALPEKIKDIRRSDNSSFWDQGYPALMVTDTSFLRNPHYHQATDRPDTLDYARLARVTLGIAGAVSAVVGGGRVRITG